MELGKKFAGAINCMDGRVQDAVAIFLRKKLGVDYVDAITEPGPDLILAENTDAAVVVNIKKRVGISLEKHGAKTVAIVAHADCAGNPVTKEEHLDQLQRAKETVANFGFEVEIILVWVDLINGNWVAEEVIK